MSLYILRRLGEGLVTLIALSFVVFGSIHLTGDPARFLIPVTEAHDEEVYQAQREAMGLDRPFIIQYLDFLQGALRAEFGKSFIYSVPVKDLILDRLPATVHLALTGMIMAFAL